VGYVESGGKNFKFIFIYLKVDYNHPGNLWVKDTKYFFSLTRKLEDSSSLSLEIKELQLGKGVNEGM